MLPVVLLADGCAATAPLAAAAAASNAASICGAIGGSLALGATVGEDTCVVRSASLNATFNLQTTQLAVEIMGGCGGGGSGGGSPAFDSAWAGAKDATQQVRDELRAAVLKFQNGSTSNDDDGGGGGSGSGGIALGPDLVAVGLKAADGVAAHALALVGGYEAVFTCPALASTFFTAKDAVCCATGGAFFWLTGGWVAIGLVMSCFGCCAGVFGHKRLAKHTWGPHRPAHGWSRGSIVGDEGYGYGGGGGGGGSHVEINSSYADESTSDYAHVNPVSPQHHHTQPAAPLAGGAPYAAQHNPITGGTQAAYPQPRHSPEQQPAKDDDLGIGYV